MLVILGRWGLFHNHSPVRHPHIPTMTTWGWEINTRTTFCAQNHPPPPKAGHLFRQQSECLSLHASGSVFSEALSTSRQGSHPSRVHSSG